jgi:hypothetical protein
MPGQQHVNLIKTLLWFLSERKTAGDGKGGEDDKGDSGGRAWVVASFHSGRAVVASFFDMAATMGLDTEEIWEGDGNAEGGDGEAVVAAREWKPVREDEGPDERRRWYVVAVMKRKQHVDESIGGIESEQGE